MTKKIIWVVVLFIALISVVSFEQVYTENSLQDMFVRVDNLQTTIDDEDLTKSKANAMDIVDFWADKERVICLFVDYRDIEQITKQANLVVSHLDNKDFELAKVECNALYQAVQNFYNMVKLDFTNIF